MKPRVALVTAGHLSTCPRMLKAADALAGEGYEVIVVSTSSTAWAEDADFDVLARRLGRFRSETIDYSRGNRPGLYLKSGLRRRIARAIASRAKDVSYRLATRAFTRVHEELTLAALGTWADFYYGGTTGGIAAAFEAASQSGQPYALDLEDFFSGEPPEGSLDARLAERIEREILPGARFLTASSGPIAEAYTKKYRVEIATDPQRLSPAGSSPRGWTRPDKDRSGCTGSVRPSVLDEGWKTRSTPPDERGSRASST